uniref:Uncharacterized protein n=1 Tax=Polysiphonia sp. TaxID=1967842 RepID=A0A1Z1M4I9_9FLOR|nr:hypothetical protein [Polysiphonia sp.]
MKTFGQKSKAGAVLQGEMPDIVTGTLPSNKVIKNMNGNSFVITLSGKAIEYIRFLFISLRAFLIAVIMFFIIRSTYSAIANYFSNFDSLDVSARKVKTSQETNVK